MVDLRSHRLEAGLTQTELAERSGVPQPNIAAHEAGLRSPKAATIEHLMSALNLSAHRVLAVQRNEVIDVLNRHGMTNVRVFGSASRRRDGTPSDIDLLVNGPVELDLLDLIDAADELETLLERPVDIVTARALPTGHEILRTAVSL